MLIANLLNKYLVWKILEIYIIINYYKKYSKKQNISLYIINFSTKLFAFT